MAAGKHGSPEIKVFLLGGYNLLANRVQSVSRKVEEILDRVDGLGDSWEDHGHTGMSRGLFSQDGAIFDDTTDRMHTLLKAAPQTGKVGLIAWGGNAVGAVCTGFKGKLMTGYEVLGRLPGITRASATYGVSGHVEEGALVLAHAQQSGDWTSAALNNGASSANGGSGYLEVSEITGFTSVTIKIRDSADDITYADLITFTAVTAGPTAERLTVAGTVDQYLLTTGVKTGSGTITPCVAFMRN